MFRFDRKITKFCKAIILQLKTKRINFLETYKLPRWSHEVTENLNRISTSKEIKPVIKNI